jgi:hypothetical protein
MACRRRVCRRSESESTDDGLGTFVSFDPFVVVPAAARIHRSETNLVISALRSGSGFQAAAIPEKALTLF